MTHLQRKDLLSLEAYSAQRDAIRRDVISHKRLRVVSLSDHLRLCFEDRQTISYQIQEMLRIERIFEVAAIDEELAAYNPLIPDGRNLKATMMIEYPEVEERRQALAKLGGIEDTLWLKVGELPAINAIANEDMDRTHEDKTSAVHFLRFELTQAQIQAAREHAPLFIAVQHPNCELNTQIPEEVASNLLEDFSEL